MEILERIKNLEGKIDFLSQRSPLSPSATAYPPLQTGSLPSPLAAAPGVLGPSLPASSFQFAEASGVASNGEEHYRYVSSVHEMLKWPAMQQLFASLQPKLPGLDLTQEGDGAARLLVVRSSANQNLPADTPPPASRRRSGIVIPHPVAGQAPFTASDLNWETMQRLSKAYFDSINLSYPIVNRQCFMSETLPSLFNNGFSENMTSTLAFLVFALGEVAIEASDGLPVHMYDGRVSGVKGGTKDRPPGLELFNEARRRMGFNLTECSLENIQVFALARYGTDPSGRGMLHHSCLLLTTLVCLVFITGHVSITWYVDSILVVPAPSARVCVCVCVTDHRRV